MTRKVPSHSCLTEHEASRSYQPSSTGIAAYYQAEQSGGLAVCPPLPRVPSTHHLHGLVHHARWRLAEAHGLHHGLDARTAAQHARQAAHGLHLLTHLRVHGVLHVINKMSYFCKRNENHTNSKSVSISNSYPYYCDMLNYSAFWVDSRGTGLYNSSMKCLMNLMWCRVNIGGANVIAHLIVR